MIDINNPKPFPGHNLLQGKSVIVTAAAGAGIGFAVAKRALEEGCRGLYISDVHETRLRKAVDALLETAPHDEVYGCVCDVRDESHVQGFIDAASTKFSGIDIVFNNAGMGTSKLLVDMEDDEWNQVIDITLTGTMRMTRHSLRVMKAQNSGGAIINNASVLGWRAQTEQSHYAAAKAGVMALTRCVALEAAPLGVRINAVAPSLATHPFLKKSAPAELLNALEQKEAYGRGAEVWEVANVMMFLASDYSSYMTGETVSCSSQRG